MRGSNILNFIRDRWRRIVVLMFLAILIAASAITFWAGSQIASPTRRPLQDYHHEFLAPPEAHGFQLDRFTASDGTPCLVCSPSATLGDRGVKICQQLTTRGVALQPSGKIIGTLVLLHGRKGRKEDYLPIAERLCAAGFRCVIPDLPDLPAHGDHPTTIATYGVREAELPARVLDEAALKFAFEKQPAGLLGMSMGGSVAVHAAARPDAPWRALVVISSFDSFPAAIEGQASRYIGTTLGPQWPSAAGSFYHLQSGIDLSAIQPRLKTPSIHIPTFIAHGTADRVVSIISGRRLFDSLSNTTLKKWQEIPGADHDNVLITRFPIYADIAEWMLRNVSSIVPGQ